MNILENIWFVIALSVIGIILLVDPKNSMLGSGQKFIYQLSTVVIATFFILSVSLSCIT
jgi:hypothetical protein